MNYGIHSRHRRQSKWQPSVQCWRLSLWLFPMPTMTTKWSMWQPSDFTAILAGIRSWFVNSSATSQYLNQCLLVFNHLTESTTVKNNWNIFIQESAIENGISKISVICLEVSVTSLWSGSVTCFMYVVDLCHHRLTHWGQDKMAAIL